MTNREYTEKMKDNFIAAIYGMFSLSSAVSFYTYDVIDNIREKCPKLYCHEVKRACNAIEGTNGRKGEIDRIIDNMKAIIHNKEDRNWISDYGRKIHDIVRPHMDKLAFAIANELGKFKDIPDINTFAQIITAQSLAAESAGYADTKSEDFRGFKSTFNNVQGEMTASGVIRSLSCKTINKHLIDIAIHTLGGYIPDDLNLLRVKTIRDGVHAVLNTLQDTNTWKLARDYADEVNNTNSYKNNEKD